MLINSPSLPFPLPEKNKNGNLGKWEYGNPFLPFKVFMNGIIAKKIIIH